MALLSRKRRRLRDFPEHRGDGATKNQFLADQGGDDATFQTTVETARFSRPRRRRYDSPDQGGEARPKINSSRAKAETTRLFRLRRRRRDFSDRGGDGAFFETTVETAAFQTKAEKVRPKINSSRAKAETTRLFRLRRRRRDFSDRGGDGAFFETTVETAAFQTKAEKVRPKINSSRVKAETTRLFRLRRRRRDFSDRGGDGATFQTETETARLLRPR